mgnify:CR=1 FL=1
MSEERRRRAEPRAAEEPHPPEPSRRARSTIVVAAEPDEVFAVLADGRRYADWVVGASEVGEVDPDFPAVGSAFRPRVGVQPLTRDGRTEVSAVDPGRRLELLATVQPFGHAHISFELSEDPGGTLVVMEEEALDQDVVGAAARQATRAVRARNAETLWRLKVLVERSADLDSPGSSAHPAASLPDGVASTVARVFAWATGLRNGRVFHPRGGCYLGRARLHERAVGLLGDRPELDAVVRVSRGIGLPDVLPDFNGLAVRLLDAHGEGRDQDLLLVSSGRLPVGRHVLVPVPFVGWTGYSSILPYRSPEGLRVLGAAPFEGLTSAGVRRSLPVEVRILGASLLGAWEPEVDLTLTEPLDGPSCEALRFDPWHTGPRFLPAGVLNRLRLPAYAASQAARRP